MLLAAKIRDNYARNADPLLVVDSALPSRPRETANAARVISNRNDGRDKNVVDRRLGQTTKQKKAQVQARRVGGGKVRGRGSCVGGGGGGGGCAEA